MTRDRQLEFFASVVMNASWQDQREAMKRYLAVCEVEALIMAMGDSNGIAAEWAARRAGVGPSTVRRWLRRADGNHPVERIRWLLPRPNGRKPCPHHTHLHRNSEILSLEEAL